MDEDGRLFQQEEQIPDLLTGNEPEASDEATQELLEEIDRSLKSFEQAARTHPWLGDAGLNAEEKLVNEADQARKKGNRAGAVDLAVFVKDAVRFDGGAVDESEAPVFTISLPPSWSHGLEGTIGYDADTRSVKLTTDMEITSDAAKRPVAFLGRGHPLVRRALDRVRSITYGSGTDAAQDHRVSAVRLPVPNPKLLYTFLGRLSSGAGRELERVLAVLMPQGGTPEVLPEAQQWSGIADPKLGIRSTEVWKQSFGSWASSAYEECRGAAGAYFRAVATEFAAVHRKSLGKEQAELDAWLSVRAKQITGDPQPVAVQVQLFGKDESAVPPQATWMPVKDPAERLAKFYTDSTQPHAARNEADGVLRLYRRRAGDLSNRMAVREPEIIPVGLLMIVPAGVSDVV
jgi:hypothetical protein